MDRQITCRVRKSEEARMKAAAVAAGLTLAEWMRVALLKAARVRSTGARGSRPRP